MESRMRDYQLQKDASEVKINIDIKINDVIKIIDKKVN
jgi:hypothetical protein